MGVLADFRYESFSKEAPNPTWVFMESQGYPKPQTLNLEESSISCFWVRYESFTRGRKNEASTLGASEQCVVGLYWSCIGVVLGLH